MTRSERYHHGSVPIAAVAAATEIVRGHGVDSLTVRAVAERIDVSHAAIYRHLSSRAALVDRVGAGWLDVAVDRLRGSVGYAGLLVGYVEWALESESLYRCALDVNPGEGMLAPAAIGRLRDLAALRYRADVGGSAVEVRDGVFATWGQAHGLLDLYWNGLLRAADPGRAATYISDLVIRTERAHRTVTR